MNETNIAEEAEKIRARYDHARRMRAAAALPRLSEVQGSSMEMPGRSLSEAEEKGEPR